MREDDIIKNLTAGNTVLVNRVITLEEENKKLREALEEIGERGGFLSGEDAIDFQHTAIEVLKDGK